MLYLHSQKVKNPLSPVSRSFSRKTRAESNGKSGIMSLSIKDIFHKHDVLRDNVKFLESAYNKKSAIEQNV